jgi:hypothetical protein
MGAYAVVALYTKIQMKFYHVVVFLKHDLGLTC